MKTTTESFEFNFPCPFHNSCRRPEEVKNKCGEQMRALLLKKEGETHYEWRAFSDFCDDNKNITRGTILRALNDFFVRDPGRILHFVRYLKQEPIAVSF